MPKPLLSILIPTTPEREVEVSRLMEVINQYDNHEHLDVRKEENYIQLRHYSPYSEIEVVIIGDNKEMTIGEKRELLYKAALGFFSWQIDSDDLISDDAIQLILEAIKSNPEIPCITFREMCIMNGVYKSSNHSIKYEKWQDNFDGYDYTRCPFYKDVIRTDIAQSVPFERIRYGEDVAWSYAIKPFLIDEIHIDKELYYYIYNPTDTHSERYGIKD